MTTTTWQVPSADVLGWAAACLRAADAMTAVGGAPVRATGLPGAGYGTTDLPVTSAAVPGTASDEVVRPGTGQRGAARPASAHLFQHDGTTLGIHVPRRPQS